MKKIQTYKFILDVRKKKGLPIQSLPITIDVKSGTSRAAISKIKRDFLKDHYSANVRNISKRK